MGPVGKADSLKNWNSQEFKNLKLNTMDYAAHSLGRLMDLQFLGSFKSRYYCSSGVTFGC